MAKIRILIVDDHTLFRETLRNFLERDDSIEVIGEAGDGIEAMHQVERLQPDIVLMDVAMPNVNGLQATRQIKKGNPSVKVIMLTMYDTEQYISEMMRVGASGYILKRASAHELLTAIHSVSRGDAYLFPPVTQEVMRGHLEQTVGGEKAERQEQLTARERELICLIADGETNKRIAELLNISYHTVQTHRLNLMKKLNVHDSAQLVRYAIRKGLVVP